MLPRDESTAFDSLDFDHLDIYRSQLKCCTYRNKKETVSAYKNTPKDMQHQTFSRKQHKWRNFRKIKDNLLSSEPNYTSRREDGKHISCGEMPVLNDPNNSQCEHLTLTELIHERLGYPEVNQNCSIATEESMSPCQRDNQRHQFAPNMNYSFPNTPHRSHHHKPYLDNHDHPNEQARHKQVSNQQLRNYLRNKCYPRTNNDTKENKKTLCHFNTSTQFSIVQSILLILSLLHIPTISAATQNTGTFHPSQILSSTSPLPQTSGESSSNSKIPLLISSRGDEVKADEVLYHFYRNGRSRNDYKKPSITFMVELFNDLQRGGTLGYSNRVEPVTDTVRSFSGKNSGRKRRGKRTVDFHVPYLPQHETLRAAEIRFVRNPKRKAASRRFRLRMDVAIGGKLTRKHTFRLNSKTQYEYDVFDVTSVVRPWINKHHGNVSLHIRVSKKLRNHVFASKKSRSSDSTSLIVLYLEDKEFLKNMYTSFTRNDEEEKESGSAKSSKSASKTSSLPLSTRKRRDTASTAHTKLQNIALINNTSDNILLNRKPRETTQRRRRNRKNKSMRWYRNRRENCKMYDFNVDFNVIGWGQWIVHPKRFNSKFCFGQCPSPIEAKYHPTNHAMLQTLMRMKRPNVAPVPCCVPTKLKPLSMLYFEYDEVVVRSHEDMIAEQCGCR